MARITLNNYRTGTAASDEQCRALECGDILYFPQIPFAFPIEDQQFLLGQKQTAGSLHKNVSYRPVQDRLTGIDQRDEAQRNRVHAVMQAFSKQAVSFLAAFFPSYATSWKIDFASYRPLEEQGRDVSQRSRNDLIHVDNFPSRPSNGDRLLRVFANINPERRASGSRAIRSRLWLAAMPARPACRAARNHRPSAWRRDRRDVRSRVAGGQPPALRPLHAAVPPLPEREL